MLYWPLSRYLDEEEGRVEVILEGSDRIDSTWKEYSFRFKPGDTSDRLPIACIQTLFLRCLIEHKFVKSTTDSSKVNAEKRPARISGGCLWWRCDMPIFLVRCFWRYEKICADLWAACYQLQRQARIGNRIHSMLLLTAEMGRNNQMVGSLSKDVGLSIQCCLASQPVWFWLFFVALKHTIVVIKNAVSIIVITIITFAAA